MEAVAVLLVLAVAALFVGGPIMAVVAFARVRALERRIAAWESGLPPTPPPVPVAAVPVARPAPAPAASSIAAPMVDTQQGTAPPEDRPAVVAPAAREPFDWESLIAGRWLNRVGLLAVAIGMSYFLKLAIDDGWIGPRGQVAIGLILGAAVAAWSMTFVRRGMPHFADGLAGLGASILYLSLWSATSYYGLVPTTMGFAAMIAVTAAMLAIALGRDSQTVAALALIGGFLTPWLVSTGENAQVALFLYLALHNAALLVLAHRRDWRLLEPPAFVLTQVYFWGWFDRFYTDAALVFTAASAAGFFAMFSALPVIRVRRSGVLPPEQQVLVLANAAVVLIAVRTLLWPDHRWLLTLAVLALSGYHLLLARATPRVATGPDTARLLFAGLALTCATVAIPMRLDGHWITLAWSIEAAVLAWSGFTMPLTLLRVAAYVIFGAVGLRLVRDPIQASTFILNARLATAIVVAASATAAAWFARRAAGWLSREERVVVRAIAVAANVLVIWAMTMEVGLYFLIDPGDRTAARATLLARSLTVSLLWTLCATALVLAGVRLKTAALRWQGLALFGLTTMKVFFADLGYLSGFYRIGSSVALGVVLLIVSYLYQQSIAARPAAGEEAR